MIRLTTLFLACLVAACGGAPSPTETMPPVSVPAAPSLVSLPPSPQPIAQEPMRPAYVSEDDRLVAAAAHATPGPRRVLETARAMINDGIVVRGSCWDWAYAVFTRARGATQRVFGGRPVGPFADTTLIQPGDWIYLSRTDGPTHSAIFVAWEDEPARIALMVSYAGGRSETPGRFGHYDLNQVYRIMRLSDSEVVPPPPRRQHRHHQ